VVFHISPSKRPDNHPCPECDDRFDSVSAVKKHIEKFQDGFDYRMSYHWRQQHNDDFFPFADSLEAAGWKVPVRQFIVGDEIPKSACCRPKTKDEYRKKAAVERASGSELDELPDKLEYYLSDQNLKRDDFYRRKITSAQNALWF
jgi:hypothetical protein